jgi:hypothetical protein
MPTSGGPDFNPLPAMMGFMGVALVGGIILYIYMAIVLMVIARKTHTPGAGLAWLPIGNLVLMCRIGRQSSMWVLIAFVPLLNMIALVVMWMGIAEARGKPSWAGALVLLPGVGLLMPLYLAAGQETQSDAVGVASPTGPVFCGECGAQAAPGETFCGSCGQALPPAPVAVSTPPQRTPAGKMVLAASAMVIVIVALIGGVGWLTLGRALAYTPPPRKAPALPQRMAGRMKEFPVDTSAKSPVKPTSVVTQEFPKPGTSRTSGSTPPPPPLGSSSSSSSSSRTTSQNRAPSVQVPPKWLPPGMQQASLPQVATGVTATAYRPPSASGAASTPATGTTSTTQPTGQPQGQSASGNDFICVLVLDIPQDQPQGVTTISTSIANAANGQQTGVQVQSPGGDVYTGTRIRTATISVYVLKKQGDNVVIIVYAPTPAGWDTAARLATNVGNGEGLNDYPETQNSIWVLPQTPPDGFVLQEVKTQTPDDWGVSSQDLQAPGADARVQQQLAQLRQFIPQRATSARYQDGAGQEWDALVFDYESARQAWNLWMMLRWTVGLGGMQSVSVGGSGGLYTNTDEGRVLAFQKGPYLVLLKGPSSAPLERMTEFAGKFQM